MSLPPALKGPQPLRVLQWVRNPFQVLDACHRKFGDAFTLNLLGFDLVIVSDPEVVKQVFALGPDDGHAGKANFILKPFLGEGSLLLLDGSEHLRHRKMILPAFHGDRMHAYGRTMIDLANDSIDRWAVGTPFSVQRPMQAITLQVIIRTVFGVEEGPRFAALAELLTRGLNAGASPWLLFSFMQHDLGRFSPWGRFQRLGAASSEILRSEIRRGREQGTEGRSDVLAMMLDARDERGQPLTIDEIHDELLTLLIAGHETTATALAWTLRWVLPDRALVSRLREEIATADRDPQRIAKLELLDATVKEALRLQPIIPIVARVTQRPMRLGALDLPAGVAVAPSVYLVHRRPSIYPEPDRFRPERFLTFKPSPWEWLPFGGGLRRCVGAAFATYEMKMVLASILSRVDARLATDRVRVSRRGVTIAPSEGLPIVVTARRSREAYAKVA
jgi:cytochrome P450